MALTQEEKNGSASGAEPPTPKSAPKARWFNNFLTSGSGFDTSYNNILNSSRSSFGLGSEDIEAEAAIEVKEDLELDDSKLNLAYNCRRHLEDIQGSEVENQSWRMRERMKTVSVALVVCLNIGIDPPDVMKTRPCAKVECWVDPNTLNSQRAGESIGSNLQKQYERWQPRARYRLVLDPTVEEVRRLATGLRRNARDERVLFHYNGHGVPKPTANGEIWVFNRNFTQYIPLSLYELQLWMGSPSIFVYDCSNAGVIVSFFEQFAEQHEKEYLDQVNAQGVPSSELSNPISPRSCIQLAACSANQILPMHPDLPADLFTSCLTTPIKMALRWFVMQNQGKLSMKITLDMIDKIPGQFGDRRTMLGELNWIFTAITDTIAWNTLQRPLFQRLFRQDLLVASLFRNFLLAERVMRSYDCAPVSQPALPPTHQHPMWQAWDLAVDIAVSQLPDILEKGSSYKSSTFFEEELTAFEVWLRYGNEQRPPPEQLPIVLQVLLSQAHRLRALDLLGRFLDLGPWAVNLALSVGIFPYVLKLLQSSARELKPLLVEIWAKILAVDSSCQSDLVRDGSQKYFVSVLQDECMMPIHRTWATFILACLVQNCRPGQQEAEQTHLIAICIEHLEDPNPVFRQWLAVLLGRMWDHYEPARWRGARDNAPERLYELLKDPVPEVRAAAVFALGTFINSCDERSEQANNLDHGIASHLLKACDDGSSLVRCELIVALQYVVRAFEPNFVNVCRAAAEEEEINKQGLSLSKTLSQASSKTKPSRGLSSIHASSSSSCLDSLASNMPITSNRSTGSLSGLMAGSSSVSYVYSKVYNGLVFLANDPHIEVSSMASKIVEYLKLKAKDKEAARAAQLESSSMPSSPSRLSFIAPPRLQQAGVATIAEESSEALSSSADNRSGSSFSDSRLRRGRSEGRHPSGGQHSNVSPQSSNTNISPTNNASANGLRRVAALNSSRSIVPPQLDTSFISWSAKYFTKPQAKHDPDPDPESAPHLRRAWMFLRNSELRNEGEVQNDLLREKRGRIDGPVSPVGAPTVFRNPQQFVPNVLKFHPFSDEIIVAGQSSVTVWNTKQSRRISAFDINENRTQRTHGSISAIEFLNSHDETLLMVGSDDGGIRIYKDYAHESYDDDSKSDDGDGDFHLDYFNKYRIVAAWNGLKDNSNSGFTNNSFHRHGSLTSVISNLNINKNSSGLRTAWSQVDMTLAVTGAESRYISLWDAKTELRKNDLYTSTDAPVTSIAYGPSHFGLLCAGFTDGSVRVFDVRSPESRAMVFEGLGGNILDCKLKGDHQRPLLIAGDSNGVIQFHELRMGSSHRRSSNRLASFSLTQSGNQITGLALHQTADAFAAWAQHAVSLHHYNPTLAGNNALSLVNVIKCHDEGVLGKGLGFEGCLAFHSHLLQIAIGSRDGAISLKAFKKF